MFEEGVFDTCSLTLFQVQTRKGSSSSMESPMELNSGSKKKESGNIEEILTCGNILYNDLQMVNVLGSGNAGTVHRYLQI